MSCFHSHTEKDVQVYSMSKHGYAFRLSEHFLLMEFASKDGADIVKVHPALILLLENIRKRFDRPVHITSGYRTPEHNARVGGAKNSVHVLGMASDIQIKGVSTKDIASYAETLKPGGLGVYQGFVHIDVWGAGRRWSG